MSEIDDIKKRLVVRKDVVYTSDVSTLLAALDKLDEDKSLALHACGIKDKRIEALEADLAPFKAEIEALNKEIEIQDRSWKVADEMINILEAALEEKDRQIAALSKRGECEA